MKSTRRISPSQGNTKIISQLKAFVKPAVSLLLCLTLVTPTYASLPEDSVIDHFDQNGIYYYNPSGIPSCSSSSTTLKGGNTAEKIWNFFIENGFNDAQTSGILGNAMAESGLIPTISSSGSYWGIFQWGGGRKDALEEKIKSAGLGEYLDPSYWGISSEENIPTADLNQLISIQLEHTLSETDHDWQNELKSSSSPEESAEIFLTLFERAVGGESPILYYQPFSGLLYQATAKRRDYAKDFYNQYAGNGTTTGSELNSCSGDLSNLTLSYAWPEYHPAPYIDRRPSYAQAVTLSQSEGRYVGGSVSGVPGIDCGGFVTVLMQNSGIAPNYNTGPDGTGIAGATGGQEKWVIDQGWTLINPSETSPVDTSLLQAGDVAFSGGSNYTENQHTFVYVGQISDFDSVIASASYSTSGNGRAPMAGKEDLIYSGGNAVRWYRKS